MENTELRSKTQTQWVGLGIPCTRSAQTNKEGGIETATRSSYAQLFCVMWYDPIRGVWWRYTLVIWKYMRHSGEGYRWESFNIPSGNMTTIGDAHVDNSTYHVHGRHRIQQYTIEGMK